MISGNCLRTKRSTLRFITLTAFFLTFCGLAFSAQLNAATVSATIYTNAPDYVPGDSVVIAGSGFWAGETITVQITPTDGTPSGGEAYDPWDVAADGNGDFETYWIVPDDALGEEMLVEATGQSSGLYATTTFTDCNTRLQIISIPTSVPTGQNFQITALLEQRCGGGTFAPLEGRTVLFFLTEQNCGVDIGQDPDETGVTNASGEATVTLTAPAYDFGVRAKFLGEAKPDPCPDPGNNACNPNDPDPKKRCVKMSASNACEPVDNACQQPAVFDLVLTNEYDCLIGTVVSSECFVPTAAAVDFTVIMENTPWANNNWLGWTPPGTRSINFVLDASDGSGTTNSVAMAGNFGLFLLNDVDLGQGSTNGTYDTPDDAWLFSEHALSLPHPPNGDYQWFVVYDVSGLGYQDYRWYDGSGDQNSFSGDYDLLIFVDDDHTSPNFDYDDFIGGIKYAEPSDCVPSCELSITCPADVTVECDESTDPTNTGTATYTGNCPPINLTYSDNTTPGSCANEYTITRTWTATDAQSNTAQCVQTITVEDNTNPQITCPADVSVQCPADVPAPDVMQVQANDNCDPDPTVVHVSDVSDGQTCPETITRTYRATDDCGNWAECTQTITVDDTQAPTFVQTCPTDVTVECDNIPTAPTLTATDNCDPAPVVTFGEQTTVGSCDQEYILTRAWTATDDCGNSTVCTQTITVDDTQAPQITCPTDVSVQCPTDVPAPDVMQVQADDNCDPSPVVVHIGDVSDGQICPETITRTYRATDDCGNWAECTQTITVDDTQAPTFVQTCPTDVTVECDNIPTAPTLTATDNCDPAPVVTFGEQTTVGSCDQEYILTRAWTATDDCGNSTVCTQTITVDDTQAPQITCPTDVSVQCPTDVPAPDVMQVQVNDNCDPDPTVVHMGDVSDNQTCPETITRTYRATDDCANWAECTQTITVDDTQPPTFDQTCPTDITVECDNIPTAPTLTATDNCDPDPVVTFDEQQGLGILTRTWTATDDCDNSTVCTQVIKVEDNTDPQITCPTNVSVQCPADVPPPDPSQVVATDNCDPAPTVVHMGDVSDGQTCPETITRTYRATDDCGNWAECTQTITVDDTQAPTFDQACPADVTVECDNIPTPPTLTATDNCDPTPVVTFGEQTTAGSCDQEYVLTRTWTATDYCNNSTVCTQVITVEDNTDPQITCPTNVSVQCPADIPPPDPSQVVAIDNCDPAPTVVHMGDVSDNQTCPETITRTYRATDDCGNWAECTQTITVHDTQAPTFDQACPTDVTVECDAIPTAPTLTASDNCDPAPVVTFDEQSTPGSCDQEYILTRTWTATDDCGNSMVCTQVITVEDNTAPTFDQTCPADVTVECDNIPTAPTLTASDNCDPAPVVTFDEQSTPGSCDQEYILTRTWTATDDCGNSMVCTQVITVEDNTAPTFDQTCPADVTVECDNIPTAPTLTATDNCDPAPVVTFDEQPGSGILTRTWTATDDCNNAAVCTQVITITPNSPPTAICPGNERRLVCDLSPITIPGFSCDDPDGNLASCVATGGTLSGDEVTFTPVEGNNTITLTATDDCGETDVCQTVITVDLNSPPTATCPGDVAVYVSGFPAQVCVDGFYCDDPDGNLLSCTVDFGTLTGNTVCFTATQEDVYTITLTATDDCGTTRLSATCATKVSVMLMPTSCMAVKIDKTHDALQGHYEQVSITIEDSPYEIGGFDFLIAYDASALTPSRPEPGQMLDDCDWEYFTYRYGVHGNCGDACPSGLLRIFALAETNDGPGNPTCFGPPDPGLYELAKIEFLVTDDRTFECQYVPIRFFWDDCSDNSISSVDGKTLFIDKVIYDYQNNVIWDEEDDVLFPEVARIPFVGAPDYCLNPNPLKPTAVRFICFIEGGIDIICAEDIDDRGDINLNGVANEIADAVLFGNYFIHGVEVFDVGLLAPEGQIAATDVNSDGITLSVADLVYLIRIVVGDALPYAKVVAPVKARYTHAENGLLSVPGVEVGGAFLLVEGDVTPVLRADNMDLKYRFDGVNTRILVHSLEGNSFKGDFLEMDGKVISMEMATRDGNPIDAQLKPNGFVLHQNYPNPFNPATTFRFTLPSVSDYTLTVFNVTGQTVARFFGSEPAGDVTLEWDAGNMASGVYFYRLQVGSSVETRKMVLLK